MDTLAAMTSPARTCPCARPSLTPREDTVLLMAIYAMTPTVPERQAMFKNMYRALAIVEAAGPRGAKYSDVCEATGLSMPDACEALTMLVDAEAVVVWGGIYYEIVPIPPRDNIVLGFLRGAGNSTVERIASRVNLPQEHVRQALAALGPKVQQAGSFWFATSAT